MPEKLQRFHALIAAATSSDRVPATTDAVVPILDAAYNDLHAFNKMLAVLQARLETCKHDDSVILKSLCLLHASLYAGRKTHVLSILIQSPISLQACVVDSAPLPKSIKLYAIYLNMRMTVYQSTKADVIAAKWMASDELQAAKASGKQKAFARSDVNLRAHRLSCMSVKEGLIIEGSLHCDLLQALVTSLDRFCQEDPDVEDELFQHAVNILEQDLFHCAQVVCEAVIAVLAVFTRLKLEDARAGLAFYARAIDCISSAKACARRCLPTSRESITSLKLPSSDLFLALADHVGKLSEETDRLSSIKSLKSNASTPSSSSTTISKGTSDSSVSSDASTASIKSKAIKKGHSRIGSLPESITKGSTGLFKAVGRAVRQA